MTDCNVILVLAAALLALLMVPATARAHGDPAHDYLLGRSAFLPFDAKVDSRARGSLAATIRAAEKAKFRIKVAVIGSRYDLGTAFSLFNRPQKYAEFLGLELSPRYRGRLLVVMPNGYGLSIAGRADSAGIRVVRRLPPPGGNARRQVEGATNAIRKLAAASGHPLPESRSGDSTARDRITIAAAALALAALLAGIVFWRRGGSSPAQA